MKKYIISPELNWYRANFHCHTVNSDGGMTPEQVKDAYKAQGYSIVAYTDHEILLDHSYLDDDNFLALTSSEYSIGQPEPAYPQILDVETAPWPRSKTIHLNVFAPNQHDVFQPAAHDDTLWSNGGKYKNQGKCDGYRRTYTKESINETVKRLNDKGFLVQLNHPYWSLNTSEDYLNIEGLWGLEILNYATELETGSEYCPFIYDEMVRSGMYGLCCTMGDDNHNRDGEKPWRESFGGSTFIGAKELKYDQIFEAMKNGNVYCASGRYNPPQFKEVYVENGKIVIECSPVENICLNGYGRCDRHITSQEGEFITHAEFDLRPSDVYFRITIKDERGNVAHTRHYFVKDFIENN
ncbi:MAG: PHP domain-containing protein [Clostridia bacterium]|nr:PHP domain-containing protein [Clostridia bacterium]